VWNKAQDEERKKERKKGGKIEREIKEGTKNEHLL
jgi:hypothetical protein